MSEDRVTIRETLISLGVPKEHVTQKIQSEIFPWYARAFEYTRLLLGGDPFTANFSFVQDIADCSSSAEIEEAFFNWHSNPARRNRLLLRIFGLKPRRSRVLRFYRKLKSRSGCVEYS